jgi:hypothetical protein
VSAIRLPQAEHPIDPLMLRGDLLGVLVRVQQFLGYEIVERDDYWSGRWRELFIVSSF